MDLKGLLDKTQGRSIVEVKISNDDHPDFIGTNTDDCRVVETYMDFILDNGYKIRVTAPLLYSEKCVRSATEKEDIEMQKRNS